MIKIERIEVSGLANALYGMRLPKLSHNKSDTSCLVYGFAKSKTDYVHLNSITSSMKVIGVDVGYCDKTLGKQLILAGSDHGKWLRQVQVSMLITAPMTFFWDHDTYKVATVKNSSSRMHKITSRNLNVDDFSWEDEEGRLLLNPFREYTLDHLNVLIDEYNDENTSVERKQYLFRLIIQDLPDSYNFTATWTGSAQTCRNQYFARRNHKQKELRDLCVVLGNLPEIGEFITCEKEVE